MVIVGGKVAARVKQQSVRVLVKEDSGRSG